MSADAYNEIWEPNQKQYENCYERIWWHIKRHTASDARILIVCHSHYFANLITKTQALVGTDERKIDLIKDLEFRGLNLDNYDYLIFTKNHSTVFVREALLPLMETVHSCRIFYREVISQLAGERCIEITLPTHPFWQQFLFFN